MGRNPLPDKIKKIRGTDQPCRLNPDQPEFTLVTDAGPAPDFLGQYGKLIFDTVCKELIGAGILQNVDIELVILLADQYDDYFGAVQELKTKKYIVDFNGNKKLNPAWRIKNMAGQKIIQLSAQLGLSPSARQRLRMIKTDKGKKKSKAGKLIQINGK